MTTKQLLLWPLPLLLAALLLALWLPPEWVYRQWQRVMVGPFGCTAWARRVDRWLGGRV